MKFVYFLLILCGLAWYILGLSAALLAVGVLLALYVVAVYNGPRMAARNAVYAALTCREMDFGQLGAIDAAVTKLCQRLGIDPFRLGPAFPMSEALPTDLERKLFNQPANVFSLRALAMHELGIPPIGTRIPKWYVVRNPLWAATAPRSLKHYRKKVLQKTGVDLVELDLESYLPQGEST